MNKRLRAVLFGPQGCGKGTQGQLLADRFDVPSGKVNEFSKWRYANRDGAIKLKDRKRSIILKSSIFGITGDEDG